MTIQVELTGESQGGKGTLQLEAINVFSPSSLPNLVAWYKADSLALSDGAAVASWADSSGSGNTVTQATGSKQPTFKVAIRNGLPVVRFTAASAQYLACASAAYAQPNTIFLSAISNTPGDKFLVDGGGGSTRNAVFDSSVHAIGLYAGASLTATPDPAGAWHTFRGVFDGISSHVAVDGGAATVGNAGSNSLVGITLGAEWDGAYNLDGDIGEVIIVNRHCTALEIANTIAYLKTRWNTP